MAAGLKNDLFRFLQRGETGAERCIVVGDDAGGRKAPGVERRMAVRDERHLVASLVSCAYDGVDAEFRLHAADNQMIDIRALERLIEIRLLEGAAVAFDGDAFAGLRRKFRPEIEARCVPSSSGSPLPPSCCTKKTGVPAERARFRRPAIRATVASPSCGV